MEKLLKILIHCFIISGICKMGNEIRWGESVLSTIDKSEEHTISSTVGMSAVESKDTR